MSTTPAAPTVKRLAPAALDRCLRTHFCTTLSACFMLVGIDQKYLTAESLSTKIVGRIARMRGLTPEWLCELTDRTEKSSTPPPRLGTYF